MSEIESKPQTMGFQAEVQQLLHLMIHSLYSNREIFLRELVSNASDACDKLRFEALDHPELWEGDSDLAIEVDFDEAGRTITIRDNGIGMSREEAVSNLGTIARSGTKEFLSRLDGGGRGDARLIGQFGVGFYSSFIVADRVEVRTRRAGLPSSDGVCWISEGTGEFTVESVALPKRGTEIILHLRADDAAGTGTDEGGESGLSRLSDLLSGWRLRSILRRYSDHISLPIRMRAPKPSGDEGAEVADAVGVEDAIEDDHASPEKAPPGWEMVNQASALWTRSKSELDDDAYKAFYRHTSSDYEDPLAWSHNRVEGRTEYTQLLFIPGRAPFDLYDRQAKHGLRLYVKRVFIMEDVEHLLPSYLRFVRGVIDAADLPLNVSREILQDSRDVKAIRDGNTRRILGLLEDLAENKKEDYAKFWSAFGAVLKEGLGEDFGNRERLAKLLRFATTHQDSAVQDIALADVVGRMKAGQESIFYITADSWQAARSSPHLEAFKARGVEVLLLTDRVDEWMLSYLRDFEGKKLQSVAAGDFDLNKLGEPADGAPKTPPADDPADAKLVERIKASLGDRVKEVRVTQRLVDSAACLVSAEGDVSGHLERILREAGREVPSRKPILEVNPGHPLVRQLKSQLASESGADGVNAQFDDWASVIFDQAMLSEGGRLEDPAGFVKRLNDLLLSLALR